MGTGPKLGDPCFEAWDEEDSMIMVWLWNSMTLKLETHVCSWLWLMIFGTQSNRRIQKLEMQNREVTVTEYANQLKALWQELDHYRVKKTKCPEDVVVLKDFIK